MPSPHAAKKTTSPSPSAVKTAEFGARLAKQRSQEFRHKVKTWNQAQDEVVVITEEQVRTDGKDDGAVIVVDGPRALDADGVEEQKPTPTTPVKQKSPGVGKRKVTPQRPTSTGIDAERKAWVRRKGKADAVREELKHVGAPRRRVVSDGHWRRDRVVKREPAITKKEDDAPKTPKIFRSAPISVGLKVPVAVQQYVQDQRERVRLARSRSPSPASSEMSEWERKDTPDYDSKGLKVYVTRRRPRAETLPHKTHKSTSDISFTEGSSLDKANTATDITIPDPLPTKDLPSRPTTVGQETRTRRFSARDEMADRALTPHTVDRVIRTSTSREKSRTPESEGQSTRNPPRPLQSRVSAAVEKFESNSPTAASPAAAPKVFGNRIEAWLGSMPDPFVEGENASATPMAVKVSQDMTGTKRGQKSADSPGTDTFRKSSRPRPDADKILDRTLKNDGDSETSSRGTPTGKRSSTRRNRRSFTPTRASGYTDVVEMRSEGRSVTPTNADGHMAVVEVHYEADELPGLSRQSTIRPSSSHRNQPVVLSASQRLSTIASRETLDHTESLVTRNSDGDMPRQHSLKRRLTKHSDLISVLSIPREENTAIRSARSIRTHRTSLKRATVGDLMNEVTVDELKYQRELRTLVDGVVPVLLQSVLSGSEPAKRAGLLGRLQQDDQSVTRPIVDIGVALERLKSAHKRIPMHDPRELLRWGLSAAPLYEDYVNVWRMGFDDVVVNLAPAEQLDTNSRMPSWSEGLEKNERDNLSHGDGERVDVAYLLKRPLVRLKYLAKTFKGINMQQPSALASDMEDKYASLVYLIRKRLSDERGRLEDEAAAAIDPTRARDPRSLAPIVGVHIDPTRRVRARDLFDMEMHHTSGQQVTCKIEIIMRDDAPDRGRMSDILFCEVSTQGRWLLFPPLPWHLVSARNGHKENELVVMVRGQLPHEREWQEVMTLVAGDEQSSFEWIQMLGLEPVPPSLKPRGSFSTIGGGYEEPYMMSGAIQQSRPPSPSEIEVPIGERVVSASRKWDESEVNSACGAYATGSLRRTKARRVREQSPSPLSREISKDMYADYPREQPQYQSTRYETRRPEKGHARSKSDWTASTTSSGPTTPKRDYQVWLPSPEQQSLGERNVNNDGDAHLIRPSMKRRTSSVPSQDLPTIPKLRKASLSRDLKEQHASASHAETPRERPATAPDSAPAKIQNPRVEPEKVGGTKTQKPPPASVQTSRTAPNLLKSKANALPSFTPAFLQRHRRSSSPLKHEYEPSTASELSDDSDLSDSEDAESITSESSAGGQLKGEHPEEQISTVGDLQAFRKFGDLKAQRLSYPSYPHRTPPASLYSASGPSLQPSDSASQGPYRGVPQTDSKAAKTVASILCWNEAGSWDSLHPEDCNIVVTPGLIEAFDLTQAATCQLPPDAPPDASPSASGLRPLVALELTPLVPLRRGTALDISIRSPPTDKSLLRTGNNIMFRSRTPEECEALYNLINRARINNPTYIALQKARPFPQSSWAEVMDRRSAERATGPSWFGLGSKKSSTYRSKGSRAASTAATESSVGTMTTAFSALRRFSGSNKFFNIAKSTIGSTMNGSRSTTSGSLESGSSTPGAIDPSMGTPLGLSNLKIRLYVRETASKWRDMGPARLTIMLPPRRDPTLPADPKTTGLQKRILICGKTQGETLLDATLGESCFERVARTGIAVSIWEDEGEVGARGGVLSTKATVYMIQMKSEREAAYAFSQVGKLRY